MKTFKKLLLSVLMSFMLISSVGINIMADDEEVVETIDTLEKQSNEVIDGQSDAVAGSEAVDIPDEYLTKVTNIAITFAWAMSGGGNFLYGACLSGGIAGIFDVTVNLLKNVIVFGPSEEDMFKEELMDKLNAIDAQIGDVNAKVDSLQDSINVAVKKIDAQLDEISIKLDKDNITNVALISDSLKKKMEGYNTLLNDQIQVWYENKTMVSWKLHTEKLIKKQVLKMNQT